jgi:hypothetical protein
MLKKKLKILTEFKTPLPLLNAEKIKIMIPYDDGRILEKNSVSIVDAETGIVEMTLTDFELQGLKVGQSSFGAKVYMKDGVVYTVSFANGCNIYLDENSGRKVWV